MSQLPSANQSPSHANPSAVPAAEPGFELTVHAWWNKNRGFLLLICALILVGIVGREAWQYFSAMHEKSIQQEYAEVADKPERLVAFAEANSGHPLAGVAYLQVADRKFESCDYKEAGAFYAKAAGNLKNEALLGRAKLGAAISQISGGDGAGGEAALKTLSADQTVNKAVRAEATYHLASLAFEAGRLDDVRKLADDVTKIDLGGSWAQRATMLLVNLPPSGKSAETATGFTAKPQGK